MNTLNNNLSASINDNDKALSDLKAKMSNQQRLDMAEIIQNEIIRREDLKTKKQSKTGDAMNLQAYNKSKVSSSKLSNSLTSEDLSDMYKSTDKNIQELRVKTLESKLNKAKREANRFDISKSNSLSLLKLPNINNNIKSIIFGLFFLIILGVRTFYSLSPNTNVVTENKKISENSTSRAALIDTKEVVIGGDIPLESENNFESNKSKINEDSDFTAQLDQRRVELEQRKLVLDEKEKELKSQMNLVTEKTTELKSIIAKLNNLRKEKDHQYEARLEQLASVYGSMTPNEAANLITKLDDEIALGLLERMPGKRMAQILGVMDQNRAIELTKVLTKAKKL